ncbi:MAG: hypothetical protein K6U11_07470 [bacterium]|nr:hypothetical protein [bacterium]
MKRVILLLVMAVLLIFSLSFGCEAEYWEQVASNGFGNPSNDYAWCMATFQGKLYVGTLNTLQGGEIWRSASGEPGSWEMVYKSRSSVFSNAGVRYLYADANQALYACTLNSLGAEILRTTDGKEWTVVKKVIGRRWNTTIRCMVRFGEYLYAGAGGYGAELYRSKDGLSWRLVKTKPSFQSSKVYDPQARAAVVNNTMIGELAVFHDQLYAFTWTKEARYRDLAEHVFGYEVDRPTYMSNSPGAFEVWRSSDGVEWEKVIGLDDKYGNGMGLSLLDPAGLANDVVTSALVFHDQLYMGTQNTNGNSTIWRTSDGTSWSKVLDFSELGERANYYIWRMISFQDKLFVGTMNVGPITAPGVTGAQIWVSPSGDYGSFTNLVHNGFDGESWTNGAGLEIPKNIGVRSFGILNDTLYAGTAVIPSVIIPRECSPYGIYSFFSHQQKVIAGRDVGCEIWRLVQ